MRINSLVRFTAGLFITTAIAMPAQAAGQLVGATEFIQILNNAELVGLAGQSGRVDPAKRGGQYQQDSDDVEQGQAAH